MVSFRDKKITPNKKNVVLLPFNFQKREMRSKNQNINSEALVSAIAEIMQAQKGKDIVSLNLNEIGSTVTDYFVVCHANSRTQVENIGNKIIDSIRDNMHEKPFHFEGFENAEWILIDYVNVVVHVFIEAKRNYYQLESLWADAPTKNYSED